ncbi:jerky protein homolog-like [Trichonephila clavipes]|nr:jerky protein homolog-like [Trichonephila clavipes]
MASKRKHSTLTLKDKLEVLKRLDKGEGVTKLATEFNVGKATICDWRKNRRKLEQYCANSSGETLENRQTAKQSLYDKVDNALHIWFTQERQRGTPLSGPIIQEKAIQLNKLMNGDASFSASIGWLDRWKKRHGVRQLTITGEKLSSDFDAAKEYVTTFANLIAEGNYSPQQIYNADETGLNFRALPKKSLASQDEKSAPGYKISKDRVTLMACSNAFGNHKLPLMVIGKSAKPRAFKNVNIKSLPVYYRSQKKAWMNAMLFKEWFHDHFVPAVKKFNKEKDLPQREILLIDKAPSHPGTEELSSGEIKAIFLPPNVTPLLHPMDQGVLQKLKQIYRKQFLRTLIEDDTVSLVVKIKQTNMKDVVYWSAESWENVTDQTLIKSRKKLWLTLEYAENQPENDVTSLLQLVQKIPGCEEAGERDINEWMEEDGETAEFLTDDDIAAAVTQEPMEEEGSDDETQCDKKDVVPHADGAAALALRYLEQQPDTTPADVLFMRSWRNYASSKRLSSLRQKKITELM